MLETGNRENRIYAVMIEDVVDFLSIYHHCRSVGMLAMPAGVRVSALCLDVIWRFVVDIFRDLKEIEEHSVWERSANFEDLLATHVVHGVEDEELKELVVKIELLAKRISNCSLELKKRVSLFVCQLPPLRGKMPIKEQSELNIRAVKRGQCAYVIPALVKVEFSNDLNLFLK